MNKARAVLYTRVSSEQQVDNTSLASQEKLGKEFCERNGYELVQIFKEEGESAKFIDRTELKKAIAFCGVKNNAVDIFLVYKFDRFSRSVENHAVIKANLSRYGVKLVSMTEHTDDSPSGRLMENILASFAQFDNEVRTERIVNGLRSRVEQGFWIWDPPLGYIRDYTSSSNPKPIIKDKSKEVFIQQAWDMFLTGHYQMAEIVRFLNSNNVRTKNNKPIDRRLISKILRNPFYAGIVYSDKFGIKVPGKHKGYVTELEFNKIQKIIENNINKAKTVYKNDEYSLNRTIKCINCGNLLSGAKSKGKKKYYYYYQCGNSNCPFRQAVNKDVAEEKFIELLESIQMPQDDLELFKEIIIDVYECEYDISIQQQDEAYNNIKKVESKLKKIQQLLEDGVYSSEEYINRKNELDAELITLKITSSELGINKDELETCINYICKFIKHLPIFWKGLSNNEKRKLNSLLFPDGLEFEKNAYRTPKIHEALVIFNTVNTINKEGTFEVIETSLGDPGETRTRNQ